MNLAQYGCWVLYFLAADSQEIREDVVARDGIELFIKCMNDHPEEAAAQVRGSSPNSPLSTTQQTH